MTDTYQKGLNAGYDAVDELYKSDIPQSDWHLAFAGLLTAIISAMNYCSPDKKIVDAIIDAARIDAPKVRPANRAAVQ